MHSKSHQCITTVLLRVGCRTIKGRITGIIMSFPPRHQGQTSTDSVTGSASRFHSPPACQTPDTAVTTCVPARQNRSLQSRFSLVPPSPDLPHVCRSVLLSLPVIVHREERSSRRGRGVLIEPVCQGVSGYAVIAHIREPVERGAVRIIVGEAQLPSFRVIGQ